MPTFLNRNEFKYLKQSVIPKKTLILVQNPDDKNITLFRLRLKIFFCVFELLKGAESSLNRA